MARKRATRRQQDEIAPAPPVPDDAEARAARQGAQASDDEGDSVQQVTTMICLTCGAEQFFTDAIPDALTCGRCGSTVFRSFTTPVARDEAAISALEEQARSVAYGDASPATTPDELRDLGR